MVRTSTVTLGAVGALVAAVGAWNLHQRFTSAEVPYTVVDADDGVELRRYPPAVLAETVALRARGVLAAVPVHHRRQPGRRGAAMAAPVEREGESIPMTAPVAVGRSRGRSVPMIAPVESNERDEGGSDLSVIGSGL